MGKFTKVSVSHGMMKVGRRSYVRDLAIVTMFDERGIDGPQVQSPRLDLEEIREVISMLKFAEKDIVKGQKALARASAEIKAGPEAI
jgi:hypothetical protein